jgi:hypothetical protein
MQMKYHAEQLPQIQFCTQKYFQPKKRKKAVRILLARIGLVLIIIHFEGSFVYILFTYKKSQIKKKKVTGFLPVQVGLALISNYFGGSFEIIITPYLRLKNKPVQKKKKKAGQPSSCQAELAIISKGKKKDVPKKEKKPQDSSLCK